CPHRQFFHIYAGQTTSQRNQSTLEPSPGPLRPGSHKHTGGTCYARKDPSGKPIPDRSGTRNGSRYCLSKEWGEPGRRNLGHRGLSSQPRTLGVTLEHRSNPVLNTDWPDPDVLRRGSEYWMTNSSFNRAPGLP